MEDQSIRVTAICLFQHKGHILVVGAQDPDKPEPHYRPPGGGVEFGETSRQTLQREIREELGAEITDVTLLTTAEEIYEVQGRIYHEVIFVYEGRFVNRALYAQPTIPYVEGQEPRAEAVWMPIGVFVSGEKRLVPRRLREMLAEGESA